MPVAHANNEESMPMTRRAHDWRTQLGRCSVALALFGFAPCAQASVLFSPVVSGGRTILFQSSDHSLYQGNSFGGGVRAEFGESSVVVPVLSLGVRQSRVAHSESVLETDTTASGAVTSQASTLSIKIFMRDATAKAGLVFFPGATR